MVAIDVQPGMLERTREKAQAAKLMNIRFVHSAIGRGTLERDRADRAVLVTVLGEIPDREAALTEIFGPIRTWLIADCRDDRGKPVFRWKAGDVHGRVLPEVHRFRWSMLTAFLGRTVQ